jgi:hypothetical protein
MTIFKCLILTSDKALNTIQIVNKMLAVDSLPLFSKNNFRFWQGKRF